MDHLLVGMVFLLACVCVDFRVTHDVNKSACCLNCVNV